MTADPPAPETRAPAGLTRRTIALIVIGAIVLLGINIVGQRALRDTLHGYYIPSEAMVPALKIGDRALAEDASYRLHDPRRGDVIVFDAPPAVRTDLITQLVKRIVGLPGERIEGRADGRIYINGRRLEEPYLDASVRSRVFAPTEIPADAYFVMGDNRQYSKDSTFYGPIERSAIAGRMYLRYWPPNRWGLL